MSVAKATLPGNFLFKISIDFVDVPTQFQKTREKSKLLQLAKNQNLFKCFQESWS